MIGATCAYRVTLPECKKAFAVTTIINLCQKFGHNFETEKNIEIQHAAMGQLPSRKLTGIVQD